jgi:MFS superfamily sulfate permease-like transporter
MFDSLPLTTPQKIGVVLYGFLAGAATAVATSLAGCMLGIAVVVFARYTRLSLGEYQPWLPLAGAEYGFFIGIVIGLIVWRRVCKNRLR